MNEAPLKPGDVVQLKSGSPKMVVERGRIPLRNGGLGTSVRCTWFVDSQNHSAEFAEDALKKVPEVSLEQGDE